MLKKFRNSPLCTALASEKFSFQLLSIQSSVAILVQERGLAFRPRSVLRGQPTEHLGIMAAARTAANALTSLVRQSPLVQDDQIYDPWLIQEVQDEYRALAQEALYWPLSAASHLAPPQ